MQYVRTHRHEKIRATIALLHPPKYFRTHGKAAPHYLLYEKGVKKEAAKMGFQIDEFAWPESEDDATRLHKVLNARGINGVLIIRARFRELEINLPWDHYCVATVENPVAGKTFLSAANHHYHTALMALRKADKLGYQRVGMTATRLDLSKIWHHMSSSFLAWQQGIPRRNWVPMRSHQSWTPGRLLEWIDRHKVDLVLSMQPEMLDWLRGAGLSVPEDIGYMSLSWSPEHPRMSGIDQNPVAIGRAAMNLLASQIAHNERGEPEIPRMLLIESRWHSGDTVRDMTGNRRG